jgi:hypothetical protein
MPDQIGNITVPDIVASGTRRLPYDDYGLIAIAPITGSGVAQAVATASYDAFHQRAGAWRFRVPGVWTGQRGAREGDFGRHG